MKPEELQQIKETAEEILKKMTITDFSLEHAIEENNGNEVVALNVQLAEPQFLIGQGGQTLLDVERILRIVLNKKLKKVFYVKLDINDYKKKKIEHLQLMARETADEVTATKTKKTLPPMSAYERRIVHMELQERNDVSTESQGEGFEKSIIISPK